MNNVAVNQVLILGTVASGTVTGVTTGSSLACPRSGAGIVSFFFRSTGTGVTTGGTILIEEADWLADEVAFSGTWSLIATIDPNDFTGLKQKAYHITNTAYGYVRARISSDITGGGKVACTLRSQGAGS